MRVSSSGLIYAVIVGAWAAYLVPMWLRRQDELNEARPTERFSTAIRLLSGKAAMERRYAKDAERREAEDYGPGAQDVTGRADGFDDDDVDSSDPDGATDDVVDVRAFADPQTMIRVPTPDEAGRGPVDHDDRRAQAAPHGDDRPQAERRNAERKKAERNKRAQVLARRRRTTMMLFLAFTLGAIVAAVGGLAFLWAPAAPALLLSAYIVHLRTQERRRFTFTMDRRRAEEAAQQLHARRTGRTGTARAVDPEPEEDVEPTPPVQLAVDRRDAASGGYAAGQAHGHLRASESAPSADRRALVEQTDHAEWVDQERSWGREQSDNESWDPVPVPLPTYVSAPVAPRTARGVDLEAPDTWSSARSSAAGTSAGGAGPEADPQAERSQTGSGRERGRTPLFDQYADDDRPRAANE
ncbi:divisome protein SepX/GlpR [Streptomyces sp. NPDC054784]